MEIKDLPEKEQPAYKIRMFGPDSLSDAELISLVGGMKSFDKAYDLLSDMPGGIRGLAYYDALAFEKMGLSKGSAEKLDAAIELGRRVCIDIPTRPFAGEPETIARLFRERYQTKQEHLVAYCLDAGMKIISENLVAKGGLNSAAVETHLILRPAIVQSAIGIILAHNHPSGVPTPSYDDLKFTEHVAVAAEFLQISFLDHIIVGDKTFYSMKEKRDLEGMIFSYNRKFIEEQTRQAQKKKRRSRER
jgi:DNA repair protein RadC